MTVFSQLIGQEQAVELLTSAVKTQHIAPAYLFSGPPGVGRYLGAIAFSTLLLQGEQNLSLVRQKVEAKNHPDLLTVEPTYLHQGKRYTEAEAEEAGLKRKGSPQIRVEQIREISHFLSRPPLEAPRAVVIIQAAQTMAEAAANALLKTLEEPGRATIILIAPSPDALLPTLVSRCQRIPFSRLATAELKQVLAQTEHKDIIEQETLCAIAQGSPGEAIIASQHLQNISSDLLEKLEKLIQYEEQSFLSNVTFSLSLAKKIANELDFLTQLWLIDYLQQLCWKNYLQSKITTNIKSQLQSLETARQYLNNYVQPRLVWEITLLEITRTSFP
ncbi:DNA polymerase III subunit delta' [Euhalothece natronophila Z-M001]|uniref:DNA polymerase III subunit delta n=1 Tax=Euhalothece natronophila Z-M001 TaxID=522448 RepID=A0A5B8NHF0_9CHRO|nr:DNA polymerase III subunit delta' [Euhalothece natronophila]QDZ38633.1 DNA polymerase III subunit delta' [Euhalothece natronophila Z-M001]